jgi:hypothetical protein
MSYEVDRSGRTCGSIFLAMFLIFFGAMFYFMPFEPFNQFDFLFLGLIVFAILLIVYGLTLVPSNRRAQQRNMSIYKIAAVRKEVTISDICTETGLDYEYVRNYLTESIMYGRLQGYLEEDLFVRDVSARRRRVGSDEVGLDSVMDD